MLVGQRPKPAAYPKEIKTIGDHLRRRRLDLGLFQRQVAEFIGVDKTSIANWEGQHGHPALIFMPAIIRFLGYNPLPQPGTLANQLVHYRVSRGLTQWALAKRLGIDPCTLARWERGDRTPSGLYRKLVQNLLA
jgi:DNA-binding XRE family transcriptional regulator